MAITIVTGKAVNKETAWDFPLDELPYLLDEHDGETFALEGGRLWECEPVGTDEEDRKAQKQFAEATLRNLVYYARVHLDDDEREIVAEEIDDIGALDRMRSGNESAYDAGWVAGVKWMLRVAGGLVIETHNL